MMQTVLRVAVLGSVFGAVWGLGARRVAAQQPASAAGTGSVVGHVIYGDSQRPARLATVVLLGVQDRVTAMPKADPGASSEAQMKAIAEAVQSLSKTNMMQAQTGMDGAYAATDLMPGDYYVFGSAPGYVSPSRQVEAAFNAGADATKPLPGVPIVHVTAEHQSTADVTMARGAAVSGMISWDDGSPVTGAMFSVIPAKGEARPPMQFNALAMVSTLNRLSMSDELGHFRISSLAPGDYFVLAVIQTGAQMGLGPGMNLSRMMAATPLVVYAPAGFHKADAKAVTLSAGQDLRDEQLTLNLHGLHTVSGRVGSAEDHHGINSGTVRLEDVADKEFARSGPLDAAGNFTVTFVPPGTYSMTVVDAGDTEPKPKTEKNKESLFGSGEKTLRSYEDGKMSVLVTDGDVTAQNLELAPSKTVKKGMDLDDLIKP